MSDRRHQQLSPLEINPLLDVVDTGHSGGSGSTSSTRFRFDSEAIQYLLPRRSSVASSSAASQSSLSTDVSSVSSSLVGFGAESVGRKRKVLVCGF